ncbi:hypothetical protein ACFYUH_22270 [Streptomyces fimicarius]|uniref:hypothetical protein n=1 Tax=Streptomyces griseus TaxID=1911 RepID=UPI00369FE658
MIDAFLEKVEQSKATIRADVVHEKLLKMGYRGSARSTRRAVDASKAAWKVGKRRTYRPWIPEPGMWLQFDWGEGPRIAGRRTWLFCAWLSWSRFRVVIPVWDCTLGTLVACLDTTLRRIGGAPTYVLTDNAKTVTVEHIAGIPARHSRGREHRSPHASRSSRDHDRGLASPRRGPRREGSGSLELTLTPGTPLATRLAF